MLQWNLFQSNTLAIEIEPNRLIKVEWGVWKDKDREEAWLELWEELCLYHMEYIFSVEVDTTFKESGDGISVSERDYFSSIQSYNWRPCLLDREILQKEKSSFLIRMVKLDLNRRRNKALSFPWSLIP